MTRTTTSRGSALDKIAPLMFLVVLCTALAIARPGFAHSDNLMTIIRQSAVIIVLAIGQTLLMISGGIDLSVGSVIALAVIVAGRMHMAGFHPIVGVIAAVAVATLAGFINGLATTKAKVAAFIATLGMMGIARGLALVLSNGVALDIPDVYVKLGARTEFFAIVVLLVGGGAYFALSKTIFGRRAYAVGGNKEASRLSGVNVDKHLIKTFTLNGFIVGIAAVLLLARVGSIASPTSGEGYELDCIAAAVIGGTSLMGGQGSVGGSLIGALIMAVLRNGCNLLNVSDYWQLVLIGSLIVIAVFYDGIRRRSRV